MRKLRKYPGNCMWFWWKSLFRSRCCLHWLEAWQTITSLIWEKIRSFCRALFGITFELNSHTKDAYLRLFRCWLCRMPFNVKTPSGYLIAFLDEFICDIAGTLTYVPLITFIFGSCWLITSFINDISNDLSSIEASNISSKTVADLKKAFRKIIDLYSNVKG